MEHKLTFRIKELFADDYARMLMNERMNFECRHINDGVYDITVYFDGNLKHYPMTRWCVK